ncbi:hypothetical protein VPNG_08581 [Cytospora leucostoma]|uniref:Uncharacterized protein n=1 Tax=Cytospora leucostoma TaxID=1230097 RepID=A0A423W477_9PEZI|nr:hypothetical protein VPNG_08581 [Cytospora leucostoma]
MALSIAGPLSSNLVLHSETEDDRYAAQHEGLRSDGRMVSALKETEPKDQQSEYAFLWANEDTPQFDLGPSEAERPRSLPQDHKMAEIILTEDLSFFTALLKGSEPPRATRRLELFLSEEQKAQREIYEAERLEAQLRRRDESKGMQADMDFYLMLMQRE